MRWPAGAVQPTDHINCQAAVVIRGSPAPGRLLRLRGPGASRRKTPLRSSTVPTAALAHDVGPAVSLPGSEAQSARLAPRQIASHLLDSRPWPPNHGRPRIAPPDKPPAYGDPPDAEHPPQRSDPLPSIRPLPALPGRPPARPRLSAAAAHWPSAWGPSLSQRAAIVSADVRITTKPSAHVLWFAAGC